MLIEDKLKAYNYEDTWQDIIFEMIQSVLSVPLEPDNKDFTLSKIRNKDRLNELEFYFPLNHISPAKLRTIFQKHGNLPVSQLSDFSDYIGRLNFSPVQGFMKGFIDMVFQFDDRFWLIDWKSNFLGDKSEDYNQTAMTEVMKENYYFLQYHIYTLALHQYLKLRKENYNYESDFGGVFYIFLRGASSEKDFGIFRDKPSYDFIEELSSSLISIEAKYTKR